MFSRSFVLLLLLLLPLTTWAAQLPGIRLYERGEYAKASRALKEEINNPRRTDQQKAQARVYLAASLLALEKEDDAYLQIEELVRLYPEQRVDPALFPPELVEMEQKVRALVEQRQRKEAEAAERERQRQEAELAEQRRKEQEEADRNRVDVGPREDLQGKAPSEPVSAFRLRPELTGYSDAAGLVTGSEVTFGPAVGLTAGVGPVEATVRALVGDKRWAWELEAGYLFGTGAFQPRLSVRATLFPGVGAPPENDPNGGGASFGFGGAVGGRLALSPRFSLLADVGGEYLPGASEAFNSTVFVISAGVGYSLF
jgi:tetratricopeptide (TPR) repeat protein